MQSYSKTWRSPASIEIRGGARVQPERRAVRIALLACGVLLYVAVYAALWGSAPVVSADTDDYVDLATRLVTGTWTAPHDRMIGYPLLLALFGATEGPVGRSFFYFQLLAHAAAVLMLERALARLGVGMGVRVAFVLILLSPPFVDEAGIILTECATGVALAGVVYGLARGATDRPAFLWMAGVSAGAALLFRPVYLFFGAALVGTWLLSVSFRSAWRGIVPLLVPGILIVAAVVGVQYTSFGYLGLTPKSGVMLFTRTSNMLERIPDDHAELRELLITYRDKSLVRRGSSHTGVTFMWGDEGALTELLRTTGKSLPELSSEMFRINLRLIASAPLEYLAVVARDAVTSWFPSASPLSFFGSRLVQLLWAALHFAIVFLYLVSLCSFVTGVVARATGRRALMASPSLHPSTFAIEAALHMALWYTCLLSALVEVGQPRYMLPVLPLAVMAIALSIARWRDLPREVVVVR